jgi:hypothetical protein
MSNRGRDWLVALALFVCSCVAYRTSLSVGFFSDDFQWLGRMNATIERPGYLFTVFFRDFNPVLHASFAFDWLLAGLTPSFWHAHSVLLHACSALLLFLLCRRLGAGRWLALASAATWAVNVRISEAVIWPAARGHQLAALSALAALVLLLSDYRHRRWLALIALTLGLFAKETTLFAMAAIPFFLPSWKKERLYLVGHGALAIGFVLLNLVIKDNLHTSDAGIYALLMKTPFILLRPLGLGDYARFDMPTLIVVAALIALGALLLRRGPGLAALLWVLACSAPIVPLDKLSSRYLYLPAIGYAVLLCVIAMAALPRLRSEGVKRVVRWGFVTAIIAISATNLLLIQREVEDYRLLSQPYMDLVERASTPLASVAAGQSLVYVDGSSQTTIRELTETIQERGNITKLIPYRRHAIDGLIELPDLLNVARARQAGQLGRGLSPPELKLDSLETVDAVWLFDDGHQLRRVEATTAGLPDERVHRAVWDVAASYFAR